ncbi:hypothetical protein YC2023_122137 [Brassica napus]
MWRLCHDGYLNGSLSVTRTLGLGHETTTAVTISTHSGFRDQTLRLTEEYEFLIMGSEGIWDVLTSQEAVRRAVTELPQNIQGDHREWCNHQEPPAVMSYNPYYYQTAKDTNIYKSNKTMIIEPLTIHPFCIPVKEKQHVSMHQRPICDHSSSVALHNICKNGE